MLITAGLVSGCAAEPSPAGTSAMPSPAATQAPSPESPDPTTTGPRLVPEGAAADNLPLFTAVAETVWASPQKAEGRAYIDGLVMAGFDQAAMQITDDATTIGNPAESLQFSVQWGQECLIGQVGSAADAVITITTDALPGGGCLLGATRPIDW
ncbi:hypothetical protein H9651_02825 [Microbacterium sp. Sa4CUA7]|uniref:DUF6993 domain-containing protein n=1 Tax=Microbacterium pullorum TaxID=2762236 RepID=A0ABR8RZB4_9MICO|nr:hypothetical protein [Microbacterium pullorum]